MPAIPKVEEPKVKPGEITSEEHALALARTIAGSSKAGDRDKFAQIMRICLRDNKEIRIAVKKWYTNL